MRKFFVCDFMKRITSFLAQQWFSVALIIVLGATWVLPSLPSGPWIHHSQLVLVGCIFFITGLSIRTSEVVDGLHHWRLHSFIQVFSLGFTVATFWLGYYLWSGVLVPHVDFFADFSDHIPPALILGFMVLCALPTTITSSVVFTSQAQGNRSAALVNASLGNLLGIIITPLWFMLGTADYVRSDTQTSFNFLDTIQKLGTLVVVPVVLGQVCRHYFMKSSDETNDPTSKKNSSGFSSKFSNKLNQSFLLVIIFLSFQQTYTGSHPAPHAGLDPDASDHLTHPLTWQLILLTGVMCVGLFAWWISSAWWLAQRSCCGFNLADRRCAAICSCQKTLALGYPLIAIYFHGYSHIELIALPILIYHPLQLIVTGMIAARMGK